VDEGDTNPKRLRTTELAQSLIMYYNVHNIYAKIVLTLEDSVIIKINNLKSTGIHYCTYRPIIKWLATDKFQQSKKVRLFVMDWSSCDSPSI